MTSAEWQELEHLDTFAGGKVVRAWLERIVRTRGFATGASLRDALELSGLHDANWRVERWLHLFQRLGWLVKGAYSPTREMSFFGVGGMSGGTMAQLATKRSKYGTGAEYGSEWVSPVAFAWGIKDPQAALPETLCIWLGVPPDC